MSNKLCKSHSTNFPLKSSMNPESFQDLETKIAFLERHIEEQDRVIMKFHQKVETIFQEIGQLKTTLQQASSSSSEIPNEKPPHY